MAQPTALAGNDKWPSGSWSFGPLTITWSIKSATEVDVDVSVLGVDVDTLKGTIGGGNVLVEDDLNVLGIVTGKLSLEGRFGQGPATDGLWVEGQLKGPGFDTGDLNLRIIPW